MLIIDKSLTENRLLVTIDLPFDIDNNLVIKLISRYSNKTYNIELPASTSPFPNRYYEFFVEQFDCEVGRYAYEIIEMNNGVFVQLLEIGLLEVIDANTTQSDFVSIPTEETDDDFIIFNG